MGQDKFNRRLIEFLDASPTPFHAVEEMSKLLLNAGFEALDEHLDWTISPGKGYFVTRNQSSIVAFRSGSGLFEEDGFRMVATHTDSPCLKIKPNPDVKSNGYLQLGVEVYGGALLHPWFDRDLSIAGRVNFSDSKDQLGSVLVDFKQPLGFIPSLAIHLNREANSSNAINPQKDLPVIILQTGSESKFSELLLDKVQMSNKTAKRILGFDLSLYDTQGASSLGVHNDFLVSARLDNLLSCFVGLSALLADETKLADDNTRQPSLLVCNDHEEVGSTSASGAQGPFLKSVLQRFLPEPGRYHRAIAASMLFSADNAHAVHPNYADKHDKNHGPTLNGGPVIKVNANQRYASNSETIAFFAHLCEQANIPFQTFVTRSDIACGSTIGPLTAAEIGVRTLDIGVPTMAMHSIREIAGTRDPLLLKQALTAFYASSNLLSPPGS